MRVPSIIGLIPARAGSKRVPGKNLKNLNGHPLLAYTISAALQSLVFDRVIVSTECEKTAEIAVKYGAEVPFLRPTEFSQDLSPDIDWVKHLITQTKKQGRLSKCFAILRPTSPFRQSNTIKRAWQQFLSNTTVDSLRAVEKCSQHPAKMWVLQGNSMSSVMKNPDREKTPWHSMPYQSLPEIYVQNASLEISYCQVPLEKNTIAGDTIMPFLTKDYEGFDVNLPEDWFLANYILQSEHARLPEISLEN
jgi:CMP-N,N'-diacetyllegionaminic acid synthase